MDNQSYVKAIAAINCIIKWPDGKLFGRHTDYISAISAIEEGLQGLQPSIYGSLLAGKLFVVIGASGAGKAIAYVAKENGARVVIAKRTYNERQLVEIVGAKALSLEELRNFHPENYMILANNTSIDMQPKVDDTQISKVCVFALILDKKC
ncbi:hypothetical protein R3W88_019545 [Solanum pinnatisectum]|uniref:Uncharacterized protein n=1 Tax=Solanum pinnatisectum TaxID=50273 RepID=A0AAV9KL68_9SOLN|nr:hypothetical protein R3W88_019545 [Solanum pinnatisectum]